METADMVKVAVSAAPYSIDKPYSYLVPESLAAAVPGVRVMVPFGRGNKESEGLILARVQEPKLPGSKALRQVLDPEPVLDKAGIDLALWMRGRYFCTVFEAVKTILPAGLWYGLREIWSLAMEPEVLVLDEPTAGLDPAGRENLMANIRDYHRNKGKTIILVSHSMDEIARNVDRILVLKNAHVLMQGTPAEVFARGEELLSAGLDVPQITRIAMELKRRGVDIDPAVYTVEALERQLLALRKGGAGC